MTFDETPTHRRRSKEFPMRIAAAVLAMACAMAACTTPRPSLPPRAGHLSRSEVVRYLAQPRPVGFLSYNGRWQGTDTDKEILLAKDGQTEVTDYGFAMDIYKGTYSVDAAGAIHVSLRHYPGRWPTMYLYTDRRSAILLPDAQSREAAYNCWPFRRTK